MHYLHAALSETLRLYPVVPLDGKSVEKDDVLPDGFKIKKGDGVGYMAYPMGRMTYIWGDDAEEFQPERWLHNGVFQLESPFKFTAFQGGPRICFRVDRNQQDILEVNKTNYETCNAEHPVHNYTTGAGRDVVELNVTHYRYFISSKGSCYGGMKLHVYYDLHPMFMLAEPMMLISVFFFLFVAALAYIHMDISIRK